MTEIRTVKLGALDAGERAALTARSAVPDREVRRAAATIVDAVRIGGDVAVRSFAARHGGTPGDGTILVDRDLVTSAPERIPPALRDALTAAAAAIETVHAPQRPIDTTVEPAPGVRVDRRWAPLGTVGIYVPGGRAAYPSSLLMAAVPARIAGVERIVVATPCGEDGTVDDAVLAAAALTGVGSVYAMGGAQAVAALAYGTETVTAVDKVVGPGGPWVTAAKLEVLGRCAIDLPAGPSEAVVVVDGSADPVIAAADLLCQAEHGEESPVVLVATEPAVADAVLAEVERQLPALGRRRVIGSALEGHGFVVIADGIDDALAFADEWAPEHLTLHVADLDGAVERVRSAGSVFVGRWTPESAGDYATGANHVLPTGGLARSHGPLSVEDFGSWRQVQTLTEAGLKELAPTIRALAGAEGFDAHRHCVDVRLEETG